MLPAGSPSIHFFVDKQRRFDQATAQLYFLSRQFLSAQIRSRFNSDPFSQQAEPR
jgi:hypothetical protein